MTCTRIRSAPSVAGRQKQPVEAIEVDFIPARRGAKGRCLDQLVVEAPGLGLGAELAEDLGVDGWFTVLWTWFRWPTVFGVLVVWAASLYHIAPNHRSPWKWELPGAVLAAVWWAVASLGFGQYLQTAASGANAVFGLLGGALSLLFWLYLMSMGLLLGAEVNSVIAGRNGFLIESEPRRSFGEITRRWRR